MILTGLSREMALKEHHLQERSGSNILSDKTADCFSGSSRLSGCIGAMDNWFR